MNFMSQLDNKWKIGDIIYCIDKSNGFIEPYQIIYNYNFNSDIPTFRIESLLDGNRRRIILEKTKSIILDCPERMYGFDIDKLYDEYVKENESKQIYKESF